jgi:phosphatidylglycerophosphate synthase
MGKSDRAFIVGALGLVTYLLPRAMDFWSWIFWAAAALTVLTCLNRLSRALREIKSR